MIRSLILLISLFLALPAFAAVNLKSAIREPGKSYLGYKYVASLFSQNPMTDAPSSKAAVDSSTPYADERSLPAVTQWESVAVMNERFAKFRDVRWLQSSDQPGFLRRSSWLFPDDGCFARAGLAILNLNKWKMPVPSKIFVFGDLNVQTANSPSGAVSWWYHVAPIVQVGGRKYVLDPAINPAGPLPLETWLAKMAGNIHSIEVAICQSGSYTPDDRCDHVTDGVESQAGDDQMSFLTAEWYRLQELNRIPANELGDKPPWLSPAAVVGF